MSQVCQVCGLQKPCERAALLARICELKSQKGRKALRTVTEMLRQPNMSLCFAQETPKTTLLLTMESNIQSRATSQRGESGCHTRAFRILTMALPADCYNPKMRLLFVSPGAGVLSNSFYKLVKNEFNFVSFSSFFDFLSIRIYREKTKRVPNHSC